MSRKALKEQEVARLRKTTIPPSEALNEHLVSHETSPIATGVKLAELLRRPRVDYDGLAPFDPDRPPLPRAIRRPKSNMRAISNASLPRSRKCDGWKTACCPMGWTIFK